MMLGSHIIPREQSAAVHCSIGIRGSYWMDCGTQDYRSSRACEVMHVKPGL